MLKLPPPVWALIYVLLAAAISWQLGWPKMPGFPLPKLGMALTFIPWILPVWAIAIFRREGTETNPTSPTNRLLVVDGPYRYTRNPMYLGLAFVYAGIAIAGQSVWALILLAVVLIIVQRGAIEPEEAFLEKRFGADYLSYKEKVRRWI